MGLIIKRARVFKVCFGVVLGFKGRFSFFYFYLVLVFVVGFCRGTVRLVSFMDFEVRG